MILMTLIVPCIIKQVSLHTLYQVSHPGYCSDVLYSVTILNVILHRSSFVYWKLFDFAVFEDLWEELLIKPHQVLRVLRPDKIVLLLGKGSDDVTLHQLVVSHLEMLKMRRGINCGIVLPHRLRSVSHHQDIQTRDGSWIQRDQWHSPDVRVATFEKLKKRHFLRAWIS